MVLANPYPFFNSPALANLTVMAQNDGNFGPINSGVVRLQGASPSGPAAWMVAGLGARACV